MVFNFPEAFPICSGSGGNTITEDLIKCLAFGEVMGLRHGLELLAPNWGPVFRLCPVSVDIL